MLHELFRLKKRQRDEQTMYLIYYYTQAQQQKTDSNIGIAAIRSLFRDFFGRLLDAQDMGNHNFRTLLKEWTISNKLVDHEGSYENLIDIKNSE